MQRRLLAVFAALSLTSLFADMTYEGARSVIGPYLAVLGAGLVVAGAVSFGDLVAYSARFLGGIAASAARSPRVLWGLIFAGYAINLVAVPLLALTGRWPEAFLLIIIERFGKGIRTAPRDAILAEVTRGVPRGLAFSLHELADQVGAVAGALIVAGVLAGGAGYGRAFAVLGIPAAAAMASLAVAYILHPSPAEATKASGRAGGRPPLAFIAATLLGMAGFMHWAQASYRLAEAGVSGASVAALYSAAMVSDALAAVPLGLLYDRVPAAALAAGPLLSLAATLSILAGLNPLAAAALWGSAMAVYETAYRAHVAAVMPEGARSAGYAWMYGAMGLGWAAGNLAMAAAPGRWPAVVAAAATLPAALLAATSARRGPEPSR